MKDLLLVLLFFTVPVIGSIVVHCLAELLSFLPGGILVFGGATLFIAISFYIIRKEEY